MMSEASPSAAAARDSPSALMILTRFSRSASAWRAMARTIRSSPVWKSRWVSNPHVRHRYQPICTVLPWITLSRVSACPAGQCVGAISRVSCGPRPVGSVHGTFEHIFETIDHVSSGASQARLQARSCVLPYVHDVSLASDPRIRLVYDEARGELARQMSALDELRARVATMLSAATIATGFLAGQLASKDSGLPWSAWVAVCAAVGVIVLGAVVLLPLTWKGGKTNVDTLLTNIDNAPGQSFDEYLRDLAGFTSGHVKNNEKKLTWLYRAFTCALVLLCVDLVGWIWALAHG